MKTKEGGVMDLQKEREAFELNFKSTQIYCRECAIRGKDILQFSKSMNGYFNIVANDAWNMWLDAKAQAVPELTDKMIVAIEQTVENQLQASGINADPFRLDGEKIWCAAIEAGEKK